MLKSRLQRTTFAHKYNEKYQILPPKEFFCYKTNRKVLNSVKPQNRNLTKFNTFLMEKVLKVAKENNSEFN